MSTPAPEPPQAMITAASNAPLTRWPPRAMIREVGLRDGLQSIRAIVPTEHKKIWIRAAHAAGQREIEVGSFVPAKLLPQLADTAELVAFARTLPGLFVSALVPNLRGAQDAIASGVDLMIVPLSASHAHSLANLRKTPDEVVTEVARVRAARDASGSRTLIEGGVGTAFGCTLQGRVQPDEVLRLMQALLDAGADRVSLADTVGYADPAHGARTVRARRRDVWRPFLVRSFPRYARAGFGQRARSTGIGRHALRRVPGRYRRLPARTRCQRQR